MCISSHLHPILSMKCIYHLNHKQVKMIKQLGRSIITFCYSISFCKCQPKQSRTDQQQGPGNCVHARQLNVHRKAYIEKYTARRIDMNHANEAPYKRQINRVIFKRPANSQMMKTSQLPVINTDLQEL